VFPACAGVILTTWESLAMFSCLSRMRGGDP